MAAKKLGKKIENSEVIFSFGGEEVELRYDVNTLPEAMRTKLLVTGLGHKLGDSAASSKTHEDMKKQISRVWDGLVEGNWTTRVPGEEKEKVPKISQKTILENLANLPAEQQEAARSLLASMGINL